MRHCQSPQKFLLAQFQEDFGFQILPEL